MNYWLHCEHLTIDKKKMSKYLGNFYTLRDLLNKGYSGKEVRWALLGTHYRSKLNFNLGLCDQARSTLKKICRFLRSPESTAAGNGRKRGGCRTCRRCRQKICGCDRRRSEHCRSAVRCFYAGTCSEYGACFQFFPVRSRRGDPRTIRRFNRVLAVFDVDAASEEAEDVPAGIMALAQKRIEARKAKDFKTADEIRDSLKAQGWVIIDTPQGMKVKKA
ncbi:MAG: hypothetical protein V8T87_13295 [Victivallales bacterium]